MRPQGGGPASIEHIPCEKETAIKKLEEKCTSATQKKEGGGHGCSPPEGTGGNKAKEKEKSRCPMGKDEKKGFIPATRRKKELSTTRGARYPTTMTVLGRGGETKKTEEDMLLICRLRLSEAQERCNRNTARRPIQKKRKKG